MAIKKFSPLLAENPLCGIGEYKDVLDLSTGGVTRRIKKYVFTGEENGTIYSTNTSRNGIEITGISGIIGGNPDIAILAICTHYQPDTRTVLYRNTDNGISNAYQNDRIIFYDANYQTVDAFQQFCAQQYSNGTPVTVWYVLSTPETETITVPSGLTGTIEGYLTQSGTPTPSAPIYPEANPALAWVPTNYRKYGTETDAITSLPAQIIGDGQAITSCQISGNTLQNGTPTPEAPVDVVGCGVRTGNLVDFYDRTTTVLTVDVNVEKQKVTFSGTSSGSGGRLVRISNYIALDPGVYILSILGSGACPSPILQNRSDSSEFYSAGHVFTLESKKIFFISFNFVANREYNGTLSIMLNTGSTALPYEPYGYKLPLTCGGTEYPIYLGQVQTTRKIKKLVLTGEENWALWSSGQPDVERYYYKWGKDTPSDYGLICTHFRFIQGDGNFEHVRLGGSYRDDFVIFISKTIVSTAADFKSYLAAQYAAGTPVTVWYVLATPETAVVNEPLMKIGDYADTVSATNIPTTGTAEQFDIQTTLKPSEVQLTYHGWHEHTDTKYTQGE